MHRPNKKPFRGERVKRPAKFVSPRFYCLGRPPECHRDVIELAAAGGELLDNLDYLLTKFPRRVRLSLHGRIHTFRLQLYVLDIHGLRDTVGECQDAISRLQLDLARGVLEAVEHAERQARHFVADRLFHGAGPVARW